jgi:Ca-activated chloride channel family protein
MFRCAALRTFVWCCLSCSVCAQVLSFPGSSSSGITNSATLNLVQVSLNDSNLWLINSANRSPLEGRTGSISKLDLKAPGKAQREFEKGYQLLMKKDYPSAVDRLTNAISVYPKYVAAYNARGSAYLGLAQNEKARDEFAQAIALDDHLPTLFLNLGCAELALKNYPAAEQNIQKASDIAPLDLDLLTALAYGQYVNQHYVAAVDTAHHVHQRKHSGAAMVHFYAAAAWEAQGKSSEAEDELNTFLREDPKSPAAAEAHQILINLKAEAARPAVLPVSEVKTSYSFVPANDVPDGPARIPANIRRKIQEARESQQLAEADADAECASCSTLSSSSPIAEGASTTADLRTSGNLATGLTFHASTDEVAVFFSATEHGVSVTNLTSRDVGIRDDGRSPAVITGFRNEADLPLRLGLVIDTSDSIAKRLKFEQGAAADFMLKVVTRPEDLAFVVGFANSVLLVQDFTSDHTLIAHGVEQLAPAGGTALWDSVAFAAGKLASHPETHPVARILVVVSDGEDNSSTATAKEAIRNAQRGGVTIYTISTRELTDVPDSQVGERALKTLAELTGGALFTPGSVRGLNGSLNDLQQVIRGRYLVTYKPASFKRDGRYRAIAIKAEKGGKNLHVYARKGYFASSSSRE